MLTLDQAEIFYIGAMLKAKNAKHLQAHIKMVCTAMESFRVSSKEPKHFNKYIYSHMVPNIYQDISVCSYPQGTIMQ